MSLCFDRNFVSCLLCLSIYFSVHFFRTSKERFKQIIIKTAVMFKTLKTAAKCAKCYHERNIHTSFFYFHNIQLAKKEHWEEKMQFWLRKYEDLFGITKLSELQQRVLEVQNKVQTTQEKRRQVQDEIFRVQKKLQEMNDILHKMSLGDNMYISVATQVHELLKEQKRLQNEFTLSDQTERELQTTLALAINNSQDHEKTYREKNKYLSLITGVVGGLLGLIGSSVNNWRHRKDIKVFAGDISNQVTDLQNAIIKLNSVPSLSSQTIYKEVPKRTEDLLSEIKIQQQVLQENINSMKSLLNGGIFQNCDAENKFYGDIQTKQLLFQLEDNISSKLNYHTSLNISLLSSLIIVGTLILYFSNSH